MSTNYVSNDLIDHASLRNKLIDRVDVLNKVKELFLIPKLEMMSTKMVAEFYEVDDATVRTCYTRNRQEIDEDGTVVKTSRELRGSFQNVTTLKKSNYYGTFAILDDGHQIELMAKSTYFSPRAVLRIGMLLRDSEVAKEVRTQLLNTFERTTVEQKTEDINEEVLLLAKALASRDSDEFKDRMRDYTMYMQNKVDVAEKYASEMESKNVELQAANDNLNTELDVAFNRFSTWESPEIVRSLMKAVGSITNNYAFTWGKLYRRLNDHYGMCLKKRKCNPKESILSTVKSDEWDKVLAESYVMAKTYGVDIVGILGENNFNTLRQYEPVENHSM